MDLGGVLRGKRQCSLELSLGGRERGSSEKGQALPVRAYSPNGGAIYGVWSSVSQPLSLEEIVFASALN